MVRGCKLEVFFKDINPGDFNVQDNQYTFQFEGNESLLA